jgi:hypothetical protein
MLLLSYFIVYSLVDALIHAGLDFTLGLATAIIGTLMLDIET